MKRFAALPVVALSLLVLGPAVAQDPIRSDHREREQVRLVLIETLAMDAESRTVPDLTRDDLRLTVGGKAVPIDTFDVLCPVGAAPDPQMIKKGDPAPPPIAPGTPRKIVLAIDFNFLALQDRPAVLDAARSMVIRDKTPAEEIMVVALADGVRIEQRFTDDTEAIVEALQRMKHDVTLWARDFAGGAGDKSYFDSVATLMDVLEVHRGAKIVVFFSTLLDARDQNDLWFREIGTRAAAGRTAIYTNWARGLQFGTPRSSSHALQRFASETGGRPPIATSDLSVQYRRAQRDLSCRYVLGFHVGDEEAGTPQDVRVLVGRSGVILRYPEQVRLWADEEKRASRTRAAFVDPEPSESTLVRAAAFPMRPADKGWDTLLTLQFPVWTGAEETTLELVATLERGGRSVERFAAPIRIAANEDGRTGKRSVTVTGDRSLKPGSYDLAVVLSQADGKKVGGAEVEFDVPAVPKKRLFVRGPLLARGDPGGLLIRWDRSDAPNDTAMDEILGDRRSLEPLLVNELRASKPFLAYWEVCLAGNKNAPPEGSRVQRRFVTGDGVEAHALAPLPFRVEGTGSMRCMHALDEIPAYTLRAGEYRLEVSVEKPGGEGMAERSAPLEID